MKNDEMLSLRYLEKKSFLFDLQLSVILIGQGRLFFFQVIRCLSDV